jgi:hypothetical protein
MALASGQARRHNSRKEETMIFIPAGLAAIAVLFFFLGRKQGKKALDMQATETSTSADIQRLAKDIATEIGPGALNQTAELKGLVECSSPLKAEMSGTECVWYRSTVTREYEESYTEKDSNGNTRHATRRGSENVSTNERRLPFMIKDETGAIEVDPEGAAMDGERVLSRFEQGEPGATMRIGNFSMHIGAIGSGRRTLGYKLEEWAIPTGRNIYVLGEARDDGGRLRIAKPGTKGGRFLISLKSEEHLVKAAKTGSTVLGVLSAVFGVAAVVVLVLVLTGVI